MKLEPLEPRRLRRPRGAYGWVDLRAVTHGHLERAGTDAALVYLFLCTVADRAGLSFWSRQRMERVLGLAGDAIDAALVRLQGVDLIARQGQIAQVLPLENYADPRALQPPEGPPPTPPVRPAIAGELVSTGGAWEELSEAEVAAHIPEARTRVEKLRGGSPDRIRRVARALALEARARRSTVVEALRGGGARG